MNILIINGSPKGKASNSLRLAASFAAGVAAEKENRGDAAAVETLHIASMKISPCKGCFACWQSTPGVCCIQDGMRQIIEKMLAADLILWSFPLYYYSVPGLLKNLIDRQLPMNLPFMSSRTDGYGSGGHAPRYDTSGTKHVLISTCGFYSAEGNYDSVTRMFDHFLGRGNYAAIFCGQGELFRVKELSERTGQYLSLVRQAGAEYADGGISDETSAKLHTLLYPREVFEKMADASWGVSRTTGEKEPEDLIFTRQMAALYNSSAYDGTDRVLEMHYTDLDTVYQIFMGKDGSRVCTDGSLKATTRVDTPFEVWAAISRGEIGGAEALGKQLYTVSGDFSLMINWDTFFESSVPQAAKAPDNQSASSREKRPAMAAMLIPWITFWLSVSIHPGIGGIATLAVCALVPLIMRKRLLVIWDQLSIAAVALLAAAANLTDEGALFTNIGYLVFGLFWLISCLIKKPLCSAYVKYRYGGDAALSNPLFMKANHILALCWGILYILSAGWTWLLRAAGLELWSMIINNTAPMAMGIFTGWFEAWYPAWKARGGKPRTL